MDRHQASYRKAVFPACKRRKQIESPKRAQEQRRDLRRANSNLESPLKLLFVKSLSPGVVQIQLVLI